MEAVFFGVAALYQASAFRLAAALCIPARAPSAPIRPAEADPASEHCTVRFADGRF
jgi:hypothetical protein